jgi:hypothetical protein
LWCRRVHASGSPSPSLRHPKAPVPLTPMWLFGHSSPRGLADLTTILRLVARSCPWHSTSESLRVSVSRTSVAHVTSPYKQWDTYVFSSSVRIGVVPCVGRPSRTLVVGGAAVFLQRIESWVSGRAPRQLGGGTSCSVSCCELGSWALHHGTCPPWSSMMFGPSRAASFQHLAFLCMRVLRPGYPFRVMR